MHDVSLVHGGAVVLDDVSWEVRDHERWVILGPNGAGKTSLLELAAGVQSASRGTVELLGARLGRVDVRELRKAIGFTSQALLRRLRPSLRVVDVVMTARHGALEPWWHSYTESDGARASQLLADVGLSGVENREFGTLSAGEQQRVLIARMFMRDTRLLLFDEPTAGLDFSGRELLLQGLDRLGNLESVPGVVVTTHHFEEIPLSTSHALLLRDGRVVAAGEIIEIMTSENVSVAFGLGVVVRSVGGRWQGMLQTS